MLLQHLQGLQHLQHLVEAEAKGAHGEGLLVLQLLLVLLLQLEADVVVALEEAEDKAVDADGRDILEIANELLVRASWVYGYLLGASWM